MNLMHGISGVVVLMLACFSGCASTIWIELKTPTLKKPNTTLEMDEVLAGAARVDITPIPGYAMGGHAVGGTTSRGYWTRLYARAIYLEDSKGTSLVLVSCDLWSIPAGLADRVAEIVLENDNGKHIGREEIILAATHTHQSPGNYSTNKAHNALAAHRAGFDIELFEFLAHRIARSILLARERALTKARIFVGRTTVEKFFRNRSLDAFVLNRNSEQILRSPINIDLPRGEVPLAVLVWCKYPAVLKPQLNP